MLALNATECGIAQLFYNSLRSSVWRLCVKMYTVAKRGNCREHGQHYVCFMVAKQTHGTQEGSKGGWDKYFLLYYNPIIRAETSQSVQLLATDWTTKGSEFESRWGQEFSLLHVVQTCSRSHPASYPMGTGGKAAKA
jgi:hypothetical protein